MIPSEYLKSAIILSDREEALKYLPKGGIVAEVGVAYGDFSERILATMCPTYFYAIDTFSMNNIWGRHDLEETGLDQEQWYRKRFEDRIPREMALCKGLSWEILEQFEDDFFDYVYIDASHNYEDVIRDIAAVERKVKAGGIIQFNDYTNWDLFNSVY